MKSKKKKQKTPSKKKKGIKEQKQLIKMVPPKPKVDALDPTILNKNERTNVPPTFLERLDKYSNLIVGIATVLLVIVTSVYIFLSWKIATETKRLADITIEQFKIRSYPTFLVERTNPTYIDEKYKDELKIYNKGEISSHETSFLTIFAVMTQEPNKTNKLSFFPNWTYVYRDQDSENIDVMDYSKKILPNSWSRISTDNLAPKAIIENLKFQILFIKHKVPYDTKYSYETHAFAWEVKKSAPNSNEASYRWEPLPNSQKNSLLESLFNSEIIALNRENKIIDFLEDYPLSNRIKFQKKNSNGEKSDGT